MVLFSKNKNAKYIEKNSIMLNHATPKTQPGGVQGALLSAKYHSLVGPLFISQLPRKRAPKLRIKKRMKNLNVFISDNW